MAIVIRTAYNNNNWKGPCNDPEKDPLCWACFTGFLKVHCPDCWERRICTDYRWGCTPRGRMFGIDAYPGVTVYLVFKQLDSNYTIWGKTKIKSTDDQVMTTGKDFEDGYAFMHFEPFEPLPRDKWVTGLRDVQLVGSRWLQGRYRYTDSNREKYLNQLIDGEVPLQAAVPVGAKISASKAGQITLETAVASNIFKKLEEIASAEGRTVDELAREAIAEFIRNR